MSAYLSRWRIEEAIRFVKQSYDFEDIRVLSYARLRNMAMDDKDGFTHYVLGRVLALAGQGDRAIADLEKSVALNPSFAQGYHGPGFTLNWYLSLIHI